MMADGSSNAKTLRRLTRRRSKVCSPTVSAARLWVIWRSKPLAIGLTPVRWSVVRLRSIGNYWPELLGAGGRSRRRADDESGNGCRRTAAIHQGCGGQPRYRGVEPRERQEA